MERFRDYGDKITICLKGHIKPGERHMCKICQIRHLEHGDNNCAFCIASDHSYFLLHFKNVLDLDAARDIFVFIILLIKKDIKDEKRREIDEFFRPCGLPEYEFVPLAPHSPLPLSSASRSAVLKHFLREIDEYIARENERGKRTRRHLKK